MSAPPKFQVITLAWLTTKSDAITASDDRFFSFSKDAFANQYN